MSKLVFPEGIYYNYKYVVGGDYIPSDVEVTNIDNLYRGAAAPIISVNCNTSNCLSTKYAFSDCANLITINSFNTSNVTDMSYMFNQCTALLTIPQLDTSNVTTMKYMFQGCRVLLAIPQLDTSNVTTMNNMFYNCYELKSIPQLDTSNVTTMNSMFYGCTKLYSLPKFNASKVKDVATFFGYSTISTLQHVGGFENLGMEKSVSGTIGTSFLSACPNLTKESVLNVLNGLYDRKTAGYSVLTLKLHAKHLAMLSDEEKAIATNKGWTLS